MSKFYNRFVGDLNRSIFLIASSEVKIPVFITMNVDFTLLNTGKRKSIAIKKYAQEWQDKIRKFLQASLSNDLFERFDFKFIVNDATNQGHSITYTIDKKLANNRILQLNNKRKEDQRIKYANNVLTDMQAAYLSQDIDNNDFEEGSRLPSIED